MPSVVQQSPKSKLLLLGCKFMAGLLFGGSLVTRRVSELLQSAPRLRIGLPSRGTSALARESIGETRETPVSLSKPPSNVILCYTDISLTRNETYS